jgi:Cu2+-exporting ATPase
MTPETKAPGKAVPVAKRIWWVLVIVLPLIFVGLCLLDLAAPASVLALIFVAVVLLPIGAKFQTNGSAYEDVNAVREGFAKLKGFDVVVVAKTGTLTAGKHSVVATHAFSSHVSADELLAIAAAVESESDHPIAKAIVSAAESKGLVGGPTARDLRAIPGVGVTAILDGKAITIGGPSLLTARNLSLTVDQLLLVNDENSRGRTVAYVIRDSELLGYISTADAVNEFAVSRVASVQRLGRQVILLSADAQGVVDWLTGELGLDAAYGEVLPHQRAEFFSRLQADGNKVCVVGNEFAPDTHGIEQIASSLEELDWFIARGSRLRAKLWQNRAAVAVLALAGIPMVLGAFTDATSLATLTYGAVLISLSSALAVVQVHSMKR